MVSLLLLLFATLTRSAPNTSHPLRTIFLEFYLFHTPPFGLEYIYLYTHICYIHTYLYIYLSIYIYTYYILSHAIDAWPILCRLVKRWKLPLTVSRLCSVFFTTVRSRTLPNNTPDCTRTTPHFETLSTNRCATQNLAPDRETSTTKHPSVLILFFFFFSSYELRAVIRIVARYHRDAFVSLSLLVAPRRVNVADNRWSIASALCHFPCYPVAVLNIEVNCLLLPGVRMTRDFIYIYINWHPRNTPRIDSWPPDSPQFCPIRILTFILTLSSLSIFISVSSSREYLRCVTRHARRFEKCEKNRAGVEKRAFQRGKIKRERRSFTREVISLEYISLFLFISFAVFYRFVWDSISLTCRIARRSEHEHSRNALSFMSRFFTIFSISFSLSLSLYHENVPVSKSLTTSKARHNKLNAGTHATDLCKAGVRDVTVPPRWIVEPSDVSVERNRHVALHCQAQGVPTPTIVWKKATGEIHSQMKRL